MVVSNEEAREPFIHRALRLAAKRGGSDLHVHAGSPLLVRINGELKPLHGDSPLNAETTERIVASILNDEQWQALALDGEIDLAYEIPGLGRYRVNAYRQHHGMDAVFRIIPRRPPSFKTLGLPDAFEQLVDYRTGMVLCTGPVGCGKSTTLSALLGAVIETRREHVVTVENPIEFVFPEGKSLVNQRALGGHTRSFSRALQSALREDPDIIAITELRDRETVSLAMTAAETGHLVLGTLHTTSAVQTINRIISVFPAEEQAQIRTMLSESLRAVVSQRLLRRADGKGRVSAYELLIVTPAVSNLIREDKTFQLPSVMQTGKAQGMMVLDDSLQQLLAAGLVEGEEVRRFAVNKERFG
jgi:twitching motility protein PilT